jgi:chromosome partitioning protein
MTTTAPASRGTSAQLAEPWVIAVANGKGGVGKTTLALELAATTVDVSGAALVVDIDPQRSAEYIASLVGDALPFDFAVNTDVATLAQLRNAREFDTIIVDCPGSLEGHDVLGTVMRAADIVLIPCVPEPAAVAPTIRTAKMAAELGVEHRVVINLADPLRGDGPVEGLRALMAKEGIPVLKTHVRRYVAHSQAQLYGAVITSYRGDKSWKNALDDARRVQAELMMISRRRS